MDEPDLAELDLDEVGLADDRFDDADFDGRALSGLDLAAARVFGLAGARPAPSSA